MAAPPAQAPTSWWLSLASRLGRVAFYCLVVENFLLLFAPLAFLLSLQGSSGFTVSGSLLLGGTLACVAAVIPVELYAHARAAGTVASLDAVAATGGYTAVSALVLAASLLYLFLTLRVEAGARPLKLSCLKWPVYGAVNVLGSVLIAGYFQGLAAGNPSLDALTLGLVVKMTLVPVLGVLAYRDLLDRFPYWGRLPAAGVPAAAVVRSQPRRLHASRRVFSPRPALASVRPVPPPPSPENTMRSLPPPPRD